MNILVIEPHDSNLQILDQCLGALGHVFMHAENGEPLDAFSSARPPDCVFIDTDDNPQQSDACIKTLRSAHHDDWFPIVALSSNNDDETFSHAILSGADALLAKPLQRSRVLMQMIALERIYLERQKLQIKKDLAAANLELLKLCMHDEVTGLANRRYFDETLRREIKLAKRERRPLSLLICSIAGLEGNDPGHHHLKAIAAAIAAVPSRPADFVCRYGDDRFAVILSNTGIEGACHVAGKIQASVDALLCTLSTTVELLCHIGLAAYGNESTGDDLVQAAAPRMH